MTDAPDVVKVFRGESTGMLPYTSTSIPRGLLAQAADEIERLRELVARYEQDETRHILTLGRTTSNQDAWTIAHPRRCHPDHECFYSSNMANALRHQRNTPGLGPVPPGRYLVVYEDRWGMSFQPMADR